MQKPIIYAVVFATIPLATLLLGAVQTQAPAEPQTANDLSQDGPVVPAVTTARFTIDGMVSNACPVLVKHAAQGIDGVRHVEASFEQRSANIEYEPSKTSPEAIARVIEDQTGLHARPACGRPVERTCHP